MISSLQEDLTPETTKKVLNAFAQGQKPKPGPQSGRQTSENSAGLTALKSKVGLQDFLSIHTFSRAFTSSLMDQGSSVRQNSGDSSWWISDSLLYIKLETDDFKVHKCEH
jgi:hypothetical protein